MSTLSSAPTPTLGEVTHTPVPAKPSWMNYVCDTDDIFWDGEDAACWFCGGPGRVASRPRMTSQHGFDPDSD